MSKRIQKAFAALLEYSLSLPGAHEDHPWGETVTKVDGKVFVFFGIAEHRVHKLNLSVKLVESGAFLLDQPWAEPTGYGLGKSGWVSLSFASSQLPPLDVVQDWIVESYRAVAKKRRIKELDADDAEQPRVSKAASSKKAGGKKVAKKKTAKKKTAKKKVAKKRVPKKKAAKKPAAAKKRKRA